MNTTQHLPSHHEVVLTVIVPFFNEAQVLPELYKRLSAVLNGLRLQYEILFVDDGSSDGTSDLVSAWQTVDSQISLLKLSRNFGKEQAMSAGLQHAQGQAIVIIDADLQDPPELIPQMIELWRQGADTVNMRRSHRHGESWFKKTTAYGFYRLINRISEVSIPHDVGDFRLLSRRVVDALNQLPERSRFMKGLFAWVGFRQVEMLYSRDERAAGYSKWKYWKLWNFAIEGITGFSSAPLKVATYIGLVTSAGSFVYALYFLLKTLTFGEAISGFPTIVILILFLGGCQLMALGIIGEYLSRLFTEVKARPLYLIDHYLPARHKPTQHSHE
jgi:glycosyltransferase involved in cell wall biosynthesis